MLFGRIGSGTKARQLPGAPQFPWKQFGIGIGILTVVLAAVILVLLTDPSSSNSVPVAQPNISPAVSVQENPPAQNIPQGEPGVITPVAWPLVRVEWTLVEDLSILPPAEEGFYNGTTQNRPYGAASTPEWAVYAGTIVPEFGNTAAIVAAAKDPNNKQVVLVGLDLAYPARIDIEGHKIIEDARFAQYLFLSVDGEKSWREIELRHPDPVRFPTGVSLPWSVRVLARDNSILLFADFLGVQDANGKIVGEGWYQATLPQ